MRYEERKENGLFDWLDLEKAVSERETPLSRLREAINWKDLAAVTQKYLNFKAQTKGGRPPKDPELMLRMCVLQSLYNLSDEETEWQAMDRLSFRQFLGLGGGDRVPDARTLWVFKERLGEKGVKALFKAFLKQMRERGLKHREGKIVDATIMEVPRLRNSREENEQIKQGQRPETFDENPARGRQKDTDARWTRKRETNYYGYKNHTKVDATSKVIEAYTVTEASVHDSLEIGKLVEEGDGFVFADSAYDSAPVAGQLEARRIKSFIHKKGCRGRELNRSQKAANRTKSSVRARVEHVLWMDVPSGEMGHPQHWHGLGATMYRDGQPCLQHGPLQLPDKEGGMSAGGCRKIGVEKTPAAFRKPQIGQNGRLPGGSGMSMPWNLNYEIGTPLLAGVFRGRLKKIEDWNL